MTAHARGRARTWAGPTRRGPIVVIGSANMDLVCRVESRPGPGETVLGGDLMTVPGGKGANQAVAAARLGAEVHFIGRVGDDGFGRQLLAGLRRDKVRTGHTLVSEGVASGCALILVDPRGENSIVVAPGANHHLAPADIDAAKELLARASVVVMQLEVPLKTVRYAIGRCRRLGTFTILDPAPAPSKGLAGAFYGVDILTPNEGEARALLGRGGRSSSALRAGQALRDLGPRAVVMKLGERGAMIVRDQAIEVPGYRVKVVDTTAAGDAFTAALAVALSEGRDLPEAVRWANAAGALCCQGFGAQPSLPQRSLVDALVAGVR